MSGAPIGIFDSGVGGLSVWRQVVHHLPAESLLYLADQAHVLENGVITLSGAARDIAADPELRRSYLGL